MAVLPKASDIKRAPSFLEPVVEVEEPPKHKQEEWLTVSCASFLFLFYHFCDLVQIFSDVIGVDIKQLTPETGIYLFIYFMLIQPFV